MRLKGNEVTLFSMVNPTYHSIIIRMPNWIGDAVMATPVIHDLRQAYPDAKLTVMAKAPLAPLFFGHPDVDEIFSYTLPNGFLRKIDHRDIIKRIKQGKYDLGVLLPNSFSSAWWFWRGDVKTRLGFNADGRRFLLTHGIPFPKERGKEHLVTTYKKLLVPLGISVSTSMPALYITQEERDAVKAILKRNHVPESDTLIGINPGAAYGSAKCWLPERFKAVTEKLLEKPGRTILYFGDAAGAPLVKEICKGFSSRVINLSGMTTLRELITLIGTCKAFLTNDSGPMHIAAALKTPLVALFGSTNDVATGPYQHGIVIHKHVECSPCYLRTCPIDFKCMKQIEVDEVYRAMEDLLTPEHELITLRKT